MKSKNWLIHPSKIKYLLVAFGAFYIVFASALPLKAQISTESEWTLVQEKEGVIFYYRLDNCSEQKTLFLRIVNKSDTTVAGNWVLNITNGQESTQFLGSIMPLHVDEEVIATCANPESNLLFPVSINDPSTFNVTIDATIDILQ
ncbi:hypothetical protein GCM10023188_09440 [Pontibacter saemangeumensis]|uniref:Uncharacterized protein n=1 Tax=Pontibacter saemangeumensis TaxID=1084525 RepID=A0ABP8LEG4_9BACT